MPHLHKALLRNPNATTAPSEILFSLYTIRNIMKGLAILLFILFWKGGACQSINYSTKDGYLLNVLARNIILPEDTTGVAVLKVAKRGGVIHVQTVYNSLTYFSFLNREFLKDRENRLPDGYLRIVPVHFYFDARNGLPEKGPSKEFLVEADRQIRNLGSKFARTEPLKLVSYELVH